MGLESLRSQRGRTKLKWWYKLVGNGKLSLVEVDKGKHGVEWLMNSFCL